MTDAKLSLAVLARISEFLQDLPEADVADLAEGRARLTVIPAGSDVPRVPSARTAPSRSRSGGGSPRGAGTTVGDPGQAREALAGMSSRDDGATYLSSWAVKDLRALAAQLGMRGVSSLKKADLIDRIVEQTIGYRLNSTAIRQL